MQEASVAVTPSTIWTALRSIDWLDIIPYGAHQALWTGNNSFRTFSSGTLNVILVLLFAGIVLWVWQRRPGRRIVASYGALFTAALVYVSVLTFLFLGREKANPSPWYILVLVVPMLVVAVSGFAHAGRPGRVAASLLLLISSYVLQLTYWAKLIPLYGGYEGRANLGALWGLYHDPEQMARLQRVLLVPVEFVMVLAAAVLLLTIGLAAQILRACWYPVGGSTPGLNRPTN
jgi:hypothetical protein